MDCHTVFSVHFPFVTVHVNSVTMDVDLKFTLMRKTEDTYYCLEEYKSTLHLRN